MVGLKIKGKKKNSCVKTSPLLWTLISWKNGEVTVKGDRVVPRILQPRCIILMKNFLPTLQVSVVVDNIYPFRRDFTRIERGQMGTTVLAPSGSILNIGILKAGADGCICSVPHNNQIGIVCALSIRYAWRAKEASPFILSSMIGLIGC